MRFFVVALGLILFGSPGFFQIDQYVVDRVTLSRAHLEPLEEGSDKVMVSQKAFPLLEEGQVVSVLSGGHTVLGAWPDPKQTQQRYASMEALLDGLVSEP